MSILPVLLLFFALLGTESYGIKLYINRGSLSRPAAQAQTDEEQRVKKSPGFWYPMKRIAPQLMENLDKLDQTLQNDLGEASLLADEILLDLRSLLTDVKPPSLLRPKLIMDENTDPDDPKRLLRISKKSVY